MNVSASRWYSVALLAAAIQPGCGSDTRDMNGGLETDTAATVTASGTDSTATATTTTTDGSSSGGSDSAGTDGVKYDVMGATSGATPDNCTGVDLLFVIDNSPSMQQYQDALVAAFPGFVDSIYDALPAGIDVHVGITTTSFSDDVGRSCDIGCLWYSNACGDGSYGCARDECYNTATASGNGYQGRLYEHDGKRYYETNTAAGDQDGLKSWFTAAASAVGEMGNNYEFSSAAAARALDAQAADFNAGFVRDEGAVLFVFFLTDQWDESIETLDAYESQIRGSKTQCEAAADGGSCIVTAGLLNPCTVPDAAGGSASSGFGDWDQGGKGPDGAPGDMLYQLMDRLSPQPIWGSITETGSYADVVGNALAEVIFNKCEEIPPVG